MEKKLLYLFFLIAFIGCKKDKVQKPIEQEININFMLEAKNNPSLTQDILFTTDGSSLQAVIPSIAGSKSLALSFDANEATVKVNGNVQKSGVTVNDFSEPVIYNVAFKNGAQKEYSVKVLHYTGIPIFNITTEAPVVSKDDYVNGSLIIDANQQFEEVTSPFEMRIKGRGNSTWGMPKKPYKIKLNSKAQILGLPAAKDWVLLANYSDKTLIRTSTVLKLGEKLGADFTPPAIAVEVMMNGEHLGNYLLTEQVEVKDDRVDIKELEEDDIASDKITGGYLIELDQRLDEDFWFRTQKNLPFTIKSPEDINTQQLAYIKTYIQQTETAIFSSNFTDPINGYAKYIDVNSFISWFLVEELVKNQDSKGYSSMFYHKDRGEKLGMGPLWDFDLSMGNVDYSNAKGARGWWVKDGVWFNRLFQDPSFKAKVRARWDEIKKKEIPEMLEDIDRQAQYLDLSQKKNFTKWDILDQYVWPNSQVLGTYDAEVKQIKNWLNTRIAWLDENL